MAIPCVTCHHPCQREDRFCSQCGTANPIRRQLTRDGTARPVTRAEEVVKAGFDAPTLTFPDEHGTQVSSGEPEPVVPSPDEIVPGAIFASRYRIREVIGEGAMAVVCSATDESIDEVIALKILAEGLASEPIAIDRFKRELKLARRIRHRNVVQSFDIGFARGHCYISMEYVDAENLSTHLKRNGRLREPVAIRVLQQVLRGLKAAHDLGIIHRDIKPGNVLLNLDGMAFVTDFGVATSMTMTNSGEVAGTPEYMAPEQFAAESVGPETDLYSCGVLFYLMLTGDLPFRPGGFNTLARAHAHEEPAPIPDGIVVSEVSRVIVNWLLQKERTNRPQRALDVLEMIDSALALDSLEVKTTRPIVLAVLDEEPLLDIVREVLEKEGYRVIGAHSTRAGIDLAFENDPVAILIDAQIGGGFDLSAPMASDMPTVEAQIPEALAFCRIIKYDMRLGRVPILMLAGQSGSELESVGQLFGAREIIERASVRGTISGAVARARRTAMSDE